MSQTKKMIVVLGVIAILAVVFMMVTAERNRIAPSPSPAPAHDASNSDAVSVRGSTVLIENTTNANVKVYFAFSADSVVLPSDWDNLCKSSTKLTCEFGILAGGQVDLPLRGRHLNVTFAFGSPVGCGSTKAELNINNPKWYDIADISLVDGYSNKISITVGGAMLGPPAGAAGNEKTPGVFPLGCDICTARQNPPCGMKPGTDGCKSGTQYKPDVPCQYQGAIMGGGSEIKVSYLGQ